MPITPHSISTRSFSWRSKAESARFLLTACAFIFLFNTGFASAEPQRIISMAPSITETLFVLGAGDRVVGVTNFCKWPEEACKRAKVGGMVHPSAETWLTLKPDLIIFLSSGGRLEAKARNLGLKTLVVDMTNLKDIMASFRVLGRELGLQQAGIDLAAKIQNQIERYKEKLKNIPRKRALLILGDSSDPGRDLFAVGPSTFLGELLHIAGGENMLKNPLVNYPKLSKEYIIAHSPEVIIEAGPKSNMSPEQFTKRMHEWSLFPSVEAVKNKQVHLIGDSYILLPGPRIPLILKRFAKALHPDVFSEPASP